MALRIYIFYTLTMLVALVINSNENIENIIRAVRTFVTPIILYIVLLCNIKRNDAKTIVLALISIAIISGIIGILQSCFGALNFVHCELERDYLSLIFGNKIGFAKPATGLFTHWNSMALYVQIYVIIMLAFSLKLKKKLYRNLSIILFVFFLIIELLTFSRGGYISSLLGIVILLWINSKKTRIISIASLGVIILATIIYLIPNIAKYYDQFTSMLYRFDLWYKGIQYLIRNPQKILFGTGWDTYRIIVKNVQTAHNIYLLNLVEMGIFNLIMLIVFIYSILRYFYKSYIEVNNKFIRALSLGLFAGYFGYFIHEFIEHSFSFVLFRNQLMVWLVLIFVFKKKIECEENNKEIIDT
jgi:O-antigen ligase